MKESDCESLQGNGPPKTEVESSSNDAGFLRITSETGAESKGGLSAGGQRVQRGSKWSDWKNLFFFF